MILWSSDLERPRSAILFLLGCRTSTDPREMQPWSQLDDARVNKAEPEPEPETLAKEEN